jgi:hypothetical protein
MKNDLSEVTEAKPIREMLIDELKESVCQITFTKVDGTIRTIRGTLRPEVFTEDLKEDNIDTDRNQEVIPFYDVDADHWKSARLDSIKFLVTNDKVYTWIDEANLHLPYVVLEAQQDARAVGGQRNIVVLIR